MAPKESTEEVKKLIGDAEKAAGKSPIGQASRTASDGTKVSVDKGKLPDGTPYTFTSEERTG